MHKKLHFLALSVAALCAYLPGASASTPAPWPERSVKLVVPFSAGGPVDVVAREVATELTQRLGQTVFVENQGGATGKIAVSMVQRASPDGYTVLFASSGVVLLQPLVEGKKPAPLVPIGMVAVNPMVLVVNDKLTVRTIPELIAYAKANPGKLHFGSGGIGGIAHLGTEMFKSSAGVDIVHVPYKGTGPLMADILADQIQGTISSYPSVKPFIDRGQLRAVGLTASSRSITSVPMIKATLSNFEFTNWYGLMGTPGTPAAVIEKLNVTLRQIGTDAAFVKRMDAQGVEIDVGTGTAMQQYIDTETIRWKKVLSTVKIEQN